MCYLYSVIESTPSPWDSGSWIESTPSPWDSGSRIDTPLQNVENYCIVQLSSWVQVGRSHDTVMGRRVVLGEIVTEGSAYRHGLLAVVKSGTDFSLSGRRHHIVKDLGDDMDRAVKRGVRERWLGRVSGAVAKEKVATNVAASAGV